MVLYVRNNNVKPTSTVKVNVPDPQHTPINNGQRGVLPSAYADMPTNANGTQANLDFDPQTISNSTMGIPNQNSTWANKVADQQGFGNQTTTPPPTITSPEYQITSDGLQIDNRNLVKENTPPPVSVNARNPSMIGGTKLTQEEYQAILKQQKQNKTKNFVPTPLPKVEKLELNAKDFFKGTKTGNEIFKPVDVFKNDGTKGIKNVKGYADFDYDGDFFGSDPFSNQKSNSKALKKQFDYYKSISNF
jgi:hypothetical protein